MRFYTPAFAKFSIMGRLGNTPELKEVSRNGATVLVANFSLAVNNSYRGADGQQVKKTSWFRFNIRDEKFVKYLQENNWQKGDIISIQGNISIGEYNTEDKKVVNRHYYNPSEIYNLSSTNRHRMNKPGTGAGAENAAKELNLEDIDINLDMDLGGGSSSLPF